MLHVFYGNSQTNVRAKAYVLIHPFEEEGLKLVRVDADEFTPGILVDASSSASLFGEKLLYLIDTPSSNADFNEEVTQTLEALSLSDNIFIVIEDTLLAAAKKQYGKYAATLEEIHTENERAFNVFALADSLSRKDKKALWLGLCEAKEAGLSSEEIIGTLWWQLKTLRLAKLTKTAVEAGMKDFPYNKAKRSLPNFKEGELEKISQNLLSAYHQGHQGEVDIDLSLEKWTLSI